MISEVRGRLRILDFDTENRPLTYLGSDYTTADLTAIAWSWLDVDNIECHQVTEDPRSQLDMLRAFRAAYEQADVVTGHYIRGHDLPILNGAMIELGMPPLPSRLASDTKLDMTSTQRVSMSQESLSAILGVPAPKVAMTQAMWRAANRLTPDGLRLTKERVVGDVRQHILMRQEMVRRSLLGSPKRWPSRERHGYVP